VEAKHQALSEVISHYISAMNESSLDYVSVVGPRLVQPVINLIEKLESLSATEPNEVQSSPTENGYSCAVVVLSALVLESALNRTRYLRKDASEPPHVADYFKMISSDQDLALDVNEVFAIRDAIVHNHLWEAKIDPVAMKFISPPELLPGYGGKRFQGVMDGKTRLSRKLKLNLFPSRICRRDAYIVFKTVGRALMALENMDRNYFSISWQPFTFHQKFVRFSEVLNGLTA
jgi:hypothetical protein